MKRFNWMKDIAVPLGLAIMDTCWLYPWALLIGKWVDSGDAPALFSPASVLILLVAARALTGLVLARRWPPSRGVAVLAVSGFVAVLLELYFQYYGGIPLGDPSWLFALTSSAANFVARPSAAVLAVPFGLYLWWRGTGQIHTRIEPKGIERSFAVGLGALVVSLLLTKASASAFQGNAGDDVAIYIVGYFLAGLTTLSIARAVAAREHAAAGGGKALPLNREWLLLVFGVVGVILLIAIGFARPASLDILTTIGRPVVELLGTALRLLFSIVLPVIRLLIDGYRFLIHLVERLAEMLPPGVWPQDLSPSPTPEAELNTKAPSELPIPKEWILVGLAIIVVSILLARVVRKWRRWEGSEGVVEDRDFVFDWPSLTTLLSWLHLLINFLSRRRREIGAASGEFQADAFGPPTPLLEIRQIYRELLRYGALVGVPRERHATPFEHLPKLQERLNPADDLEVITEAYVRARYSQNMPQECEIDDVRLRCRRVQEMSIDPRTE